jgi:hypothetical protein
MQSGESQPGTTSYLILGPAVGRDCVELWSMSRLPFQPIGELREMRGQLANSVRTLRCTSDQLVHGIYASPLEDLCDAENILFYNVGLGPFEQSCLKGLRFERIFAEPPPNPAPLLSRPLHYQCYCPSDVKEGFRYWQRARILARWSLEVASLDALKSAARVWWLMRSQSNRLQIAADTQGWFGLSVSIRVDEGCRVNAPALMKPVFDGVLSAFHSHSGQRTELVAEVLARRLNVPARELTRHLLSPSVAVLGVRQLLWPWRDSVQWNPADERCVAGELLVERSDDPRIALLGELFEVANN